LLFPFSYRKTGRNISRASLCGLQGLLAADHVTLPPADPWTKYQSHSLQAANAPP
jgi:hypothetical protein